MPECSLVQNLISCFLTFCSTIEFNPYLPFEFLIFYHSSLYMLWCLPNNYACLQVLVNNALTWQGSCVIANNARKTARLFVQDYNLEV